MNRTKILAVLGVFAVGAASQAVVVYDSVFLDTAQTTFKALTDTGSTPRHFKADTITLAAKPSWATHWRIDSISFWVINWGTAAFTGNLKADLTLWGNSTDATTGAANVFSNSLVTGVVNFGSVNINPSTGTLFTVNVTGVNVSTVTNLGFQVRTLANDQVDQNLSPGLTHNSPNPVGSSSKGWYRDADNNGVITGSDWRNFATSTDDNLGLIVNATAVPEPASMAVLGIGALALLRRRKKA